MQLKQQLMLKLSQKLQLTPQLQLAMKMLQLNHLELSELLKQEVERNPLLEVEAGKRVDGPPDEQQMVKQLEAQAAVTPPEKVDPKDFEFDWAAYLKDSEAGWYGERVPMRVHEAGEQSNLEEYVSSKRSLPQHLSLQLRLRCDDEQERKIGEYLIGTIDSAGYLMYEEAVVLETLAVTDHQLEKMVAILQSFDPPGIAARNLTECLLRQYMAQRDQDPFVMNLISNNLQELADNKMKQIARREGVDIERVLEAYDEIKRLDPKPGLHFEVGDRVHYITPDVFVSKNEQGEIEITLNEKYVPRLRINSFYRSLIRTEQKMPKKTVAYVRERLNAAKFLLESVERRKDTIFRVTKRIFEVQGAFLDEGVKGLKPLVLKDVAEHCELHESTISRVTNSKYVQTPRGLFSLKFFFSSGTTTTSGEEISSKYIKKLINDMVASENHKKPYSDAKIVKLLEARGIEIARRTVAKYREELGIRSSSKRKQFV